MEGNSCWFKPILETHLFAKGRANLHHKVAGTGRALLDSNVEMIQQVSAENQLLVVGGLMKGWRRRWGLVVGWDRAGRILSWNPELSQFWWGAGGQMRTTLQLSKVPLLAPGSFPFRGYLPISASCSGSESFFCPQKLCSHLENLFQRKGRFCLFV